MEYISVAEAAAKWGLSKRSVRNYCACGRVVGAVLADKRWQIPAAAQKPARTSGRASAISSLLAALREEKAAKISGGVYHKIQVELTYNSNHIEGSSLTHEQTRYIYETNTIGAESAALRVDDIIETANHFRCIDMIIDCAHERLRESFIKKLHRTLKSGTSESKLDWFAVGDYKLRPNEVGGAETTAPENVPSAMKRLLNAYGSQRAKSLDDILDFHYRFEKIHPFQDGNGRVGRLILFKECLRNNIVPFIISDESKFYYYRGLAEWERERGYLRETCLAAQDKFKAYLDYFGIPY